MSGAWRGSRIRRPKPKPVVIDGIRFASTIECKRYRELKLLQMGKIIRGLKVHPGPWRVKINGIYICRYTADFQYYDTEKLKTIIEDVKGEEHPDQILRIKIVQAVHGIKIDILKSSGRQGWVVKHF